MGRTVVVTGASSGIGAAAARLLHERGDDVVVVGRDAARTQAVAADLGASSHLVDLERLDDVRRLAADLLAAHPRIDVLVNNAGTYYPDHALTADGFERTFQANHLGPALLTFLLRERLLASRATVLWTSSKAARWADALDVGRLGATDEAARAAYRPLRAYGTAKLATAVLVREIDRRYRGHGIRTAAVHPGYVATSFGSGTGGVIGHLMGTGLARAVLTSARKAAGRVLLPLDATGGTRWQLGTYLENGRTVPLPSAEDPASGWAVWERTANLLGCADA